MCTGSLTRPSTVRQCVVCGSEFLQERSSGRKRFCCSNECRSKYRSAVNRTRRSNKKCGIGKRPYTAIEWRHCVACGKKFLFAKALEKRFCSSHCEQMFDSVAIKKERKRFEQRPFTFPLSSLASFSRKVYQFAAITQACFECGSVIVLGPHGVRKLMNVGRVFCDNECAGQWKSRWYSSEDCQFVLERSSRFRIIREEKERQRQSELEKRKIKQWRCCSFCGIAYKSDIPSIHCGCQKKAGWIQCEECGNTVYVEKHAQKKFCSLMCSSRHWKRNNKHKKRGRLTKEDDLMAISIDFLIKISGGRCEMCGVTCERTKDSLPTQATIDHVVPLSHGGTHTWDNVQLLCRYCNCQVKRDKTLEELMA